MIERCRATENAEIFVALFDHGDVHAHHGGDDSAADLALLGIMRFYTQDEAQLERLFSSSALGRREKWQPARCLPPTHDLARPRQPGRSL